MTGAALGERAPSGAGGTAAPGEEGAEAPPTPGRCSLRVTHALRRLARTGWGGTETVATELCAALGRQGVAAEICCTRALETTPREIVRGTPVRRFRHFYPYAFQTADGRRRLDEKGGNPISPGLQLHLLRSRAHLYHAHAVGRVGAAVRNAARLRRVPYVVSLHAGHTELPASQLAEMTRVRGMRLDLGRLVYPLLPQRRVLPDAAHVFCVGKSEAQAVSALYPRVEVSYLPNAVDTARFAAGDGARFRRAVSLGQGPLLLCIGRIDSQKNQLLLIRAMATIRERHPGATAVLLGSVSQVDYLERLRAETARLGLEENVVILPGLAHDDPLLADAYAAADVVILPSVHEPFGVVVLEAWSAAKPVVASAVGGLAGLIQEGRSGFLFPSGDGRALARAVEAVLGDPALARRLGEAGLETARAQHSWEKHAERTLAVYEQALREVRR